MTDFQNLVITPLNPTYDRTGFQCGVEALDRYLKMQAKQDVKRRIKRFTPDRARAGQHSTIPSFLVASQCGWPQKILYFQKVVENLRH